MPKSAEKKDIEGPIVDQILSQGIAIPPQPKVLIEIENLASQPKVNVKAVTQLIAKDPGLLAGIFKVVNSPAMGLSKRIESVETAISILGLQLVTNLVKSIAIRQALGGNSYGYERFWERSGDIAQIAAVIAKMRVTVCNVSPDQAYLAGLFHDCGVPVLMQRFPDYCKQLNDMQTNEWPKLIAEDQQFNTDHCVVGYLVGKQWRLPEFILRGIRYHHEIESLSYPASTVVAILQMSTHIYNSINKNPDDVEWSTSWESTIDELGISADGLKEFEEEIIEGFVASDK